jgi:hypothetical protein
MEAAIPIGTGALIGTVGGMIASGVLIGEAPPIAFCLGGFVLVVVIGIVAAVPSTLAAAWRDPVRTLRVP